MILNMNDRDYHQKQAVSRHNSYFGLSQMLGINKVITRRQWSCERGVWEFNLPLLTQTSQLLWRNFCQRTSKFKSGLQLIHLILYCSLTCLFQGECMERYSNPNDGWRHASSHNNPEECKKSGGEWVEFSNYLEKLPQYNTEQRCKAAGFSWAIPYRSEDIDKLPSNKEAWKQCLVPLSSPKCYEAPYSRSNHLGNVEGVVPLRYQWSLPYFPSGKTQRCVLRIRY